MKRFSGTLKIVWLLVELAATIRAGLATWAVVYAVSGDLWFTVFTVVTIEGMFISALFLIGDDAVAPIAALLALLFSGLMQWLEVLTLTGALDDNDKLLIRVVVSFAPIAILSLGYLRKMTEHIGTPGTVTPGKGRGLFEVFKGRVQELMSPAPKADRGEMVTVNSDVELVQLSGKVRKCSECGNTFTAKRNDAVTCSPKCRRARGRRLA